jgi:3-hydroxyacyl-[acyl-carrier protein] dehydratase/trans-2-decenoyl-[acyl-carrier protein] isomerase
MPKQNVTGAEGRQPMGSYPTRFDKEGLLACARGELFGPGNAQLPLPPMLMFDRISSIAEDGGEYGKGHVRAELDIRSDLWFFCSHGIYCRMVCCQA